MLSASALLTVCAFLYWINFDTRLVNSLELELYNYPNIKTVDVFLYEGKSWTTIHSTRGNAYSFRDIHLDNANAPSKLILFSFNDRHIKCYKDQKGVLSDILELETTLQSFPTVTNLKGFMEQEANIAKYIEEKFKAVPSNYEPSDIKQEEQFYCVRAK